MSRLHCCHDSRTSWCHKFSLHLCYFQAQMICTHHIRNRRNRNRQDSMLTADSSTPFAENRNNYICNVQIVQADCHRHNIYNRIHRTNFMKMNLICRNIMSLTLRLCQNSTNFQRNLLCILCHITMLYDISNLLHSTMFMVMMAMCRFRIMIMSVSM